MLLTRLYHASSCFCLYLSLATSYILFFLSSNDKCLSDGLLENEVSLNDNVEDSWKNRNEPLHQIPTMCISQHKDADQLCSNCTADQSVIAQLIRAFAFATQIVLVLSYINPKFKASSLLL